MLQLIAGLILLVELPAWALMIFRPKEDMTRHLIGNYLIFVPLGLLFVFLGVGLVAGQASLMDTVNSALASTEAGAATDALKAIQTGLPTLGLVVIAAMTVMDLAGGHIVYLELQKRTVSELTAGIFLVLVYLTGPIGMFIFTAWRYLTAIQQAQPAEASTNTVSSAQPSA
jgi:hypothetical protein